jgi:hypothetical protein
MPDKTRRIRAKQSAQSKKRPGASTINAPQPVATDKPVASTVPVSGVPGLKATVAGARHPYVVNELRRIGVLAGIMLAILVILALVLH